MLHPDPDAAGPEPAEPPDCFRDLRLDRIVAGIAAAAPDYDIAPLFRTTLTELDAVAYRQEVMRDLEAEPVSRSIDAFAERMRAARRSLDLAGTLDHRYEKERRFLGAVQAYCEAVERLGEDLRGPALESRALRAFRDYLERYLARPSFRALRAEADRVAADLAAIRYNLLIRGNSVTVLPYGGEPDYAAEVEAVFEKFRRDTARERPGRFADPGRLNHVEAQVLERVARLHPAPFAALEAFCAEHAEFQDPTILRFEREIQFYAAYLKFIGRLRRAGLAFCYPRLSDTSKEIECRNAFDLALAAELLLRHAPVVPNDIVLRGRERILVVTGPNQGGKTTFARMFGQLHYLAALGCPVPGTEARLFLCDRLLVQFERVEDVRSLRGKLQDDLLRIRGILERATPRSAIVLNELFASTALQDAIYLSREIMAAVSRLDVPAVWVTFLDELAAFDEKTVSLVAGVDPRDPTVRTFRLERRPPDGLAYALALAEKYRVTYRQLRERLGS